MNPRYRATCRSCFIVSLGVLQVAEAADPQTSVADDQKVTVSTTSAWSEPARADATGGVASASAGAGSGEWLVAPIPFKSALLGTGLKLIVGRVSKNGEEAGTGGAEQTTPSQERESMSGVGGMYAERETWALAAFDRRYWDDQRWRTTFAAGAGELNYSLEASAQGTDVHLPVIQDMRGLSLGLDRNFLVNGWLGAGIQYMRSPVQIVGVPAKLTNLLPSLTYDVRAVNLRAEWDTRSDSFYPEHGVSTQLEVDPTRSESVAVDSHYVRYKIAYNGYHALNDANVLAWRGYFETVSGDAPFFALPWFGSGADLRGYSPGKYIGRSLFAAQAEWRWQATGKLGFVAFAGAGGVYGQVPNFQQADFLPAAGVGLRWRLTQENRINFRVDYAQGRSDKTLLISVGEAF